MKKIISFALFCLLAILLLFVVGGLSATICLLLGLSEPTATAISTGFWLISLKKAWDITNNHYKKVNNMATKSSYKS